MSKGKSKKYGSFNSMKDHWGAKAPTPKTGELEVQPDSSTLFVSGTTTYDCSKVSDLATEEASRMFGVPVEEVTREQRNVAWQRRFHRLYGTRVINLVVKVHHGAVELDFSDLEQRLMGHGMKVLRLE